MANEILIKRGLEANRTSFTPAEGELVYTTDENKLYVGDGVTPGGVIVTDNNYTDVDLAKLAAIEENATADQTKEDIDALGINAATVNNLTVETAVPAGAVFTDTTYTSSNFVLDDLSNVTITANSSGELLTWNGTAWVNETLAEAGIQPAGSYVTTTSTQALHPTDALSTVGNVLYLNKADGTNETIDLSTYLDDTNLARIVSGTYVTDEPNAGDKNLKFVRDDASVFYIDASMFFDDTNLVTSVAGKTGAVTLVASNITDAGTAVTYDVTTSATDTTAGRLLKVNDEIGFHKLRGYGNYYPSTASVNIDNAAAGDRGLYSKANLGTFPAGPALFYYIETQKIYSGNAKVQTAVGYTSSGTISAANVEVWTRIRANDVAGGWSDWVRQYHTGNLPITVNGNDIDVTGTITADKANIDGELSANYIALTGGFRTAVTEYTQHFWAYPDSTNTNINIWKKVADITVNSGLYGALAFKATLISEDNNYGNAGTTYETVYFGHFHRSNGTLDTPNDAYLSGKDVGFHKLRIFKTATGVYELQCAATANYRACSIHIDVLGTNLGTFTTTTSITNASTTGTEYLPQDVTTNTLYYPAIETNLLDVTGTITADGYTFGALTGLNTTNSGLDLSLYHWGNISLLCDDDNNDNTRYITLGRNSQDGGTATKIATFGESGNGDVAFYEDTGTTAKFFWDASAESLGIGTSSPTNKLEVVASTNLRRFVVTEGDGGGNFIKIGSELSDGSDGYLEIHGYETSFYTLNGHAVKIDTDGNLGIGTTSPASTLDVAGIISADGANIVGNTTLSGPVNLRNPSLQLKLTDSTYSDAYWMLDHQNGDLNFRFNSNTINPSFAITEEGKVGIGNATPDAPLDISGNQSHIKLTNSLAEGSATPTSNYNINIRSAYGEEAFTIYAGDTYRNQSWIGFDDFTNEITFGTGTAGNASQRMVIDRDGNVGIGTASPSSSLDVVGTITADNVSFSGTMTKSGNGIALSIPDQTNVPDAPTNEKQQVIQINGNGGLYQVSGRGGLMLTSSDDALILANGDVGRGFTSSNLNVAIEDIYLLSDSNVYIKTDLQEGWGTEHTFSFTNTGTITVDGNTVWHAGNDGSGSGLDADTVDGVHASSFVLKSGPELEKYITFNDYDDGSAANTGLRTYVRDGTWYVNNDVSASNTINISLGGHRVWHAGNDGTGSTLDADKLDGFEGSDYLRSTADDTMEGRLTFTDSTERAISLIRQNTTSYNGIGWGTSGVNSSQYLLYQSNNSDGNLSLQSRLDDNSIRSVWTHERINNNFKILSPFEVTQPSYLKKLFVSDANQLMLRSGGSSHPTVIHRNDTSNYYILLSNPGTTFSESWNSLRPLSINLTSGLLSSSNGQSFGGGTLVTGTLDLNGKLDTSLTNDQNNIHVNDTNTEQNLVGTYFDYNVSGTQALTTTRYHRAMLTDVDFSASGDMTNGENRVYGHVIDLDINSSGEYRRALGILSDVRSSSNTNTAYELIGGLFTADDEGSGDSKIDNTYGIVAQAYFGNTSTVNGNSIYGARNTSVYASNATTYLGSIHGARNEIRIDNNTLTSGTKIGNAYATQSILDQNDVDVGVKANNSYLFWGQYQGTIANNQYGVYIDSEVLSLFKGNITIQNPVPELTLVDTTGNTQSFRNQNNVLEVGVNGTYHELWHAGNDGSGSGLDADTLDGINSTQFLRSDTNDIMSGALEFTNSGTQINHRNPTDTASIAEIGFEDNWLRYRFGGSNTTKGIRLDNYDTPGIELSRSGWATFTSDLGVTIQSTTNAAGALLTFSDNSSNSYAQKGYIEYFHADGAVGTGSNDGFIISGSEANTVVRINGRLDVNTNTVWHAGNDGSGSGLDSDTVDGLQASAFMRATSANGYYGLTAPDNNSSNWIRTTINGLIPYNSGGASSLGTSSWPFNAIYGNNIYDGGTLLENKYLGINAKAADSDKLDNLDSSQFLRSDAYDVQSGRIRFSSGFDVGDNGNVYLYKSNTTANNFTIRTGSSAAWRYYTFFGDKNELQIAGQKAWYAGNDGSGSGLDADTVDGLQASQFLRADADDTTTGNLTANGHMRSDHFRGRSGNGLLITGGDCHDLISPGTTEQVWIAAESGVKIYASSNNLSSGLNRSTTLIDTSGNMSVGGTVTATDFIATSDRRVKENLENIEDSLNKVNKLTGYTYDQIEIGERKAGIIAQDLQEVLPEGVTEDEDGKLSVSPMAVIGLLVEAVKEQKQKFEDQQKEIDELKLLVQKLMEK